MSRVTINVNGLSLVHEDSGGVSVATLPDVCLTPPAHAPVPYPNVALSRDLGSGTTFVRADGGNRIATAGSVFARSTGGEPGSEGGVTSGTGGAEASFLSHSFDVTLEGRGACRLTDKMLHNHGNTLDCAGVQQMAVADAQALPRIEAPRRHGTEDRPGHGARPHKLRKGVDSNLATIRDPTGRFATLNIDFALSRNFDFVARYLDDPLGKLTHRGLSRAEADFLRSSRMDFFALWELKQVGPSHRAKQFHSATAQRRAGRHDAKRADEQMIACGGKGLPIYFVVDFKVKGSWWKDTIRDRETQKHILRGDLVLEYFRGIKDVIGAERSGVYGPYFAVQQLFDEGLVHYGWQQIWYPRGTRIDPRSQVRQYAIWPGQTRKLPGRHVGPGWAGEWFIDTGAGLGALDLDLAWGDFGQWPK